eukprot:TRINITY_DN12252_c0_g1_i4.p3 TRINITY_DN12252_c0_g1~~TRINITY_DN12252_c0_g1_i4.p3  ORF type:complete len:299 (+),score=82.56 TRINITY_DN12252_c0_g1_i4:2248-3144(+)
MSAVTSIKVQLPNGQFRRFPFQDRHYGSSGLRSAIVALDEALLGGKTWRLQWIDNDGDRITIVTDDELSLAYEHFAQVDGVARFSIAVLPDERDQVSGWEQFLTDVVDGTKVYVQGFPHGMRRRCGPCHWKRGHGRRGRCHPQQQQKQQEQEEAGTHTSSAAAEPVATAAAAAPSYQASASFPREPPSLAADEPAVPPRARQDPPSASSDSDDWNLVDVEEDVVPEAPQVQETAQPRRRRRQSTQQAQGVAQTTPTDDKVAVLRAMGFPQDEATLSALLRRHNGEVAGVVAELFAARE